MRYLSWTWDDKGGGEAEEEQMQRLGGGSEIISWLMGVRGKALESERPGFPVQLWHLLAVWLGPIYNLLEPPFSNVQTETMNSVCLLCY